MDKWYLRLISGVALILSAVYTYSKFGPAIPLSSVVSQKNDFFTVSGEGKVTVVPDTGIINLGVTINQSAVKAAQTEANSRINKITAAIKQLGVADKDIKTENYSVYPQYDYREGTNRITGYSVSVALSVRVRDLEKINQVIDSSTANGANTVGGIQLTVDEDKLKDLRQQARVLAVKDAKDKAQGLTQAAGISLGKIVNIQENTGYGGPRSLYSVALDKVGTGGGGETQVQPGSTDITSSVTLFYETR